MATIRLDTWLQPDCTLGRLMFNRFDCWTLELPWRDNQKSISCIPAGLYKCEIYQSPKNGRVLLIKDVSGRTFIQIHSGNYTRQILGCILVGDGIKYLDADRIPDVTNSRNTLAKFLAVVDAANDDIWIDIRRAG